MSDNTRQSNLNKADSAAYKHLREKYIEEFNAVKLAKAQELGVEWQPKKTAGQKARADLAALLSANPDIRAELVSELEGQILSAQGKAENPEA